MARNHIVGKNKCKGSNKAINAWESAEKEYQDGKE